ncbi:MAG: TetR family transcriptional regulator [Lentisphaeria bacterium]|nr:TetR family transcriptional regulator [Lentisphaeria bacterium]
MARYATSEGTQAALIQAAGELFAEFGVAGVGIRAIAERAGENIGSIHYHFGSKEGLLLATLRHATRELLGDPLGRYLDEHRDLVATKRGQMRLVAGFAALFFDLVCSRDTPPWCMTLLLHTLQQPSEARSAMRQEFMDPIQNAYVRLHRLVHPDAPLMTAQVWALNRTAEAAFYVLFESAILDYLSSPSYPAELLDEARRQIQTAALLTLGLPCEETTV